MLDELLLLLATYNEEYWADYFTASKEYFDAGKPQKSIAHSLGAYGGMSSFSDALYFTGASEAQAKRGFELRETLFKQCKKTQNIFKRLLEW